MTGEQRLRRCLRDLKRFGVTSVVFGFGGECIEDITVAEVAGAAHDEGFEVGVSIRTAPASEAKTDKED
jgi:hypothetical protein